MSIAPITNASFGQLAANFSKPNAAGENPFKDLFENAVKNARDMEAGLNIAPITNSSIGQSAADFLKTYATGENPFSDLFDNAVKNVRETEAGLSSEIQKAATGQSDDLHNAMLASAKAGIAVSYLSQIRNLALDAYKEIMNTNV